MKELELLLREIDHQIAVCKNRNRLQYLKGRKAGVLILMKASEIVGDQQVSA